MLLWITLAVLIVGITILGLGKKKNNWFVGCLGVGITVVSTIAGLTMLCQMASRNIAIEADLAKYRERYKALVYEVENCRDEFGVSSIDIIKEVQEWNEEISYYQKIQDNFWVGILYPHVYDEFELIEYQEYRKPTGEV